MPEIKIITEVAGRVCALPVEVGGNVGDGDDIAFVEAMKMEIRIQAPRDGTVAKLFVKQGQTVEREQTLIEIEES